MKFKKNPYDVLQVMPDASSEVIRGAYVALLKNTAIHPDLGGDEHQTAELNDAYQALIDPEQRARATREWSERYTNGRAHRLREHNTTNLNLIAVCVHCFKVNHLKEEDQLHRKQCLYCGKNIFPRARQYRVAPKPIDHKALCKSGVRLLRRGLLHRARVDLLQAVTLAPEYPEYHYWLGRCYYLNRAYEKAWNHFSTAHSLNKSQFAYNYWQAQSSLSSKNYSRALQEFLNARAMRPRSFILCLRIGVCWFYIGNLAEASIELEQALRYEPTRAEVYAMLGVIYFSNDQLKNARAAFQKAAEYGLHNQTLKKYLSILGP